MEIKSQFGQMVTVCGKAYKWRYSDENANTVTEWKEKEFTQPMQVMIIGVRSVFNGYHHETPDGYGDWEWEFRQTRTLAAYLVVRNMRENPFYVFPDQIISEDGE